MKTSEIKTGDIYAYSRKNDLNGHHDAVLIIDASTPVHFPDSKFRRDAPALSLIGDVDAASKRRYLAAVGPIEWIKEHKDRLLALSVTDSLAKKARDILPSDIPTGNIFNDRQITAVAPAHVRLPWDEYQAHLDQVAEHKRVVSDLRARQESARNEGWALITDSLIAYGIEAGDYGAPVQRTSTGQVQMTPRALATILGITIPDIPTK